ncbi:hypothetical protein BBKW_1800 [Bifidobacterium catenulatum subsp. kashiwanohense JCM 15439 = DSM 21854]|nr:hypothetical protein BBKW_1800 [Bifidobacterium catenulatum subsp. kashiwanohense JCM 15439 = DSM 21854]
MEERTIGDAQNAVSVRIYRDKSCGGKNNAWLLWAHGGGFTEGSIDTAEAHATCAELTARTGTTCISVDYRLTHDGRNLYPAALDDLLDVWAWIVEQTQRNAQQTTLMIGGASAGGNLAAALCRKLVDSSREGGVLLPVPHAFLGAYGVFHDMQRELVKGWDGNTSILPTPLRFTPQVCKDMYARYVGRATDFPAYSVPGECDARQLHGFPPSALICCEFDDLAPSSMVFAEQLRQAGTPVQLRMAAGVLHGFLNWYPSERLPQTLAAIRFLAAFIEEQIQKQARERRDESFID